MSTVGRTCGDRSLQTRHVLLAERVETGECGDAAQAVVDGVGMDLEAAGASRAVPVLGDEDLEGGEEHRLAAQRLDQVGERLLRGPWTGHLIFEGDVDDPVAAGMTAEAVGEIANLDRRTRCLRDSRGLGATVGEPTEDRDARSSQEAGDGSPAMRPSTARSSASSSAPDM